MDRYRRSSSGSRHSSRGKRTELDALVESVERLRLHHQRLAERLSDPATVDRAVRYLTSAFRGPTSSSQGRRLEFSPTVDHDADVPSSSSAPAIPIRSANDRFIAPDSVDVLVPLEDSSVEHHRVEAPGAVTMDGTEAADAVVISECSDSSTEGIFIGDVYVSYSSVAPVQEAVASSDRPEACMESPSGVVGDQGITVGSLDFSSGSNIIGAQLDDESCVQRPMSADEIPAGGVRVDSIDISEDTFEDAVSCIGDDTPCMLLGDDCEESLSSDSSEIYDGSRSMGSVQETVVFSCAEDVSMELSSDDTQDGSVVDDLADVIPCYSIVYPQVDIELCTWPESVEEMQLEDVHTSIDVVSDSESEDDECCSISGFLYLTLGVDSALSVGGDGFLDSVLPGPTDEDREASEWQEFVIARASMSGEGVTSSVTHEDFCQDLDSQLVAEDGGAGDCFESVLVAASSDLDEDESDACTQSVEVYLDGSTQSDGDLEGSLFDTAFSHSVDSAFEVVHRRPVVQSHHVTSQLRVGERDITSTLEHFDAARQLLAVNSWGAPMTDESSGGYLSLTEIHALREAVRMLRQDYLQMVADRDHLVEWGSTAYEALLDREEEVSELTHELTATTEALEDTQRNLQESQIQLEEVTMELEHLRSTPAPNPVRLHIEVVGGEFAPTVGIEEHDVGADTHVQDLGALGTDEVGVPVESSSQVDLSHIADSVVQLAVPHFQRDHLWIAGEYVEASTYNFYCTKSFMEYLLVSADVHQDSYGVSEGILIRGSCAIRRLVGKIVETLSTMLPHRDFEVGFVES